jgi:transposase InsO family protein
MVARAMRSEYKASDLCAALEVPRSSFYYAGQDPADAALRAAIERLAGEWPTYGYRRITALLRREGQVISRKRVQRLMREMGLQVRRKPRKMHTTNSRHDFQRYANLVTDLAVVRPDQVWVADITYVRLGHGFAYLAVIMDIFTRAIRGWNLSRSLDRKLTIAALKQALMDRCPEIHHSDQGVQYAAYDYVDLLKDKAQISMAEVGEPTQNGYAERLMRTIKEEEVDLSDYRDYYDALHHIGRFIEDVYMHKRVHSALDYLTPAEFEQRWLAQPVN